MPTRNFAPLFMYPILLCNNQHLSSVGLTFPTQKFSLRGGLLFNSIGCETDAQNVNVTTLTKLGL